jgi:hypothetical protein
VSSHYQYSCINEFTILSRSDVELGAEQDVPEGTECSPSCHILEMCCPTLWRSILA